MARPAEVSDWYLLNTFACTSGKEGKGYFLLLTLAKRTSWRHTQGQPGGKLLLISCWKGAVNRRRGETRGEHRSLC